MIIEEEVYLEHFGVKGMHWGVHTKDGGSSGGGVRGRVSGAKIAFSTNHKLNQAHRAQIKANKAAELTKAQKKYAPPKTTKTFDKSTKAGKYAAKQHNRAQIDRARARISSGALQADFMDAKKQYKQDKIAKGSKAARAILKDKKRALNEDAATANQIRDGKELAGHIIKALTTTAATSSVA